MKLLLTIIILTAFLWPNIVFAQNPVATLSLSPTTATFNRNCSYNLDVNVDTGGTETDGTDAILIYDATRFQVTPSDITAGTIYPEYPGLTVESGKISISGFSSASQSFKGSGKLATVKLTIPQTAPTGTTQIKFDFDPSDKTKTSDSNVVERGTIADVLNSVTNGNYTIGTGTSCTGGVVQASPSPGQGAPGEATGSGSSQPAGGATKSPVPTPQGGELPPTGNVQTTWIMAITGSLLVILGIIGLALL